MPYASPDPITALTIGGQRMIATCWKITRADGTVHRFTDHDSAIMVPSDGTYSPAAVSASARQLNDDGSPQNFESNGAISSDELQDADLARGLYRDARVDEFQVDWRFPFAGTFRRDVYFIESVEFDSERWKAQVVGIAGRLQRRRGRILQKKCDVERLGDARCGLDLGPHTVSGVVTAVTDPHRSFESDVGGPDGRFSLGLLTWTVGSNAGLEADVREHRMAGGAIILRFRAKAAVQVGDQFDVVVGCNRTFERCKELANQLRFRGRPHLRGNDALYSTP